MLEKLAETLCSRFGFSSFRTGQLDAIESLLAGTHTLVVMPTGSGKSLIYQVAALQLPGLTVVISPLIALMKDQVDGLNALSIPATYINSTLSSREQKARLRAMSDGSCRLVYVAPERLRSVPFREALGLVDVSLLAVDEAHCVSQWGHDFRPDYLHIADTRRQMDDVLTVALTATATLEVQEEITAKLDLSSSHTVVTGFNRPNLTFEVAYTTGQEPKLRALRELLDDLDHGAAIVYVGTRREAEEVAEFVGSVAGVEARFYHGGLDSDQRTEVQEAFISGDLPVVVATNAFGMGIDRPDVRLVTHFNMPGTLEAYYQEAGRAGRDGKPAHAVLLYSPEDRALQEWFIANDAPSLEDVRRLHSVLKESASSKARMSTQDLSLLTGLPEVKVNVALAQLEQAGAVQRLGDERGRMSLSCGEWNEDALKAASDRVESRRRHREVQLEQMIAYAESSSCRRRILLAHFGDRGHAEAKLCCDNCLALNEASIPAQFRDAATLNESERTALVILDSVRRLKWDVGRGKLGQILRGSEAKDMQRMGYDKSVYYGRLAGFRAKEIESMIDQLVSSRYLKVVGGKLPVLRLTPQGRTALKCKASVPLCLPRSVSPESAALAKAKRNAGGTVELTEQLFLEGRSPTQIATYRELAERTIYNHLADLIGRGRIPLTDVISEDVVSQIREAIDRLGNASYLKPIKDLLPKGVSYDEIKCVVADVRRAEPASTDDSSEDVDPVAAFLSRSHPRQLKGSWDTGWALDFHSGFSGAKWKRSQVGELTYRLKYEGDLSVLPELVEQAGALCAGHPELIAVEALIPVPPSEQRSVDPVRAVADGLGKRLGLPVWSDVLVKTRPTAPQRGMRTRAQKRANVAGAFGISGQVRDRRLLVVDDLYDSGCTLKEVGRVLQRAGVAELFVLTLTRTIHTEA